MEHHAGIGVSLGLPSVCVVASPRHNAHPFAAMHESGFGTKPIVDGKMDIDFDSVVVDAPIGRS